MGSESPAPHHPQRHRHHRRSRTVVTGALLLFTAFAAFLGFAWFTGLLLLNRNPDHGVAALVLLAVFGLAHGLAFLNNRHLNCTLCHGSVLSEKRCRKHSSAPRIPGLSYRGTVVASVLFTGGFRCMYCGTPYRLKK